MAKPETMDVYEQLWTNSKDLAEKTLKLPFFQHMQRGDLQSDTYATFMLQDITVLVEIRETLKETISEVNDPELKAFFVERYETYKKYADEALQKFSLKDVKSIVPIEPTQRYQSFMRSGKDVKTAVSSCISNDPDHVLFWAIRMLARERLWLWLANQMKEGYGNAYFTWKRENMLQWNPEKHYKKIINDNVTDLRVIEEYISWFNAVIQHEHDICAFLVPA
ncbi:uncharacterized protein LOC134442421 [Engraulis encrasicolus]|uniref:uncharacterized protein LOC134442421 n=1 Tax=Engraulis encrasicolus TaxID=184585 RepID=UPI002FD67A86